MQNLVFAVQLKPEVASMVVDGVERPLTSGMAATVELETGSRRLLDISSPPGRSRIPSGAGEVKALAGNRVCR
jgi:hemolysin D